MEMKHQPAKKDDECRNARDRILQSAANVFAEHGYKAATTRMICEDAQANLGSINYYFGSKAALFKTVVDTLFEDVTRTMMSIPDTVSDAKTWKSAMRDWVGRALAICAARKPPEFLLARLMGMEKCLPPEMAEEINRKYVFPLQQSFERLLQMAMSRDDASKLDEWVRSTHAQYVSYAVAVPNWAFRFCPTGTDMDAWLNGVADHICKRMFARLSYQRRVG
jgi:AcrR family transcriptional regulator